MRLTRWRCRYTFARACVTTRRAGVRGGTTAAQTWQRYTVEPVGDPRGWLTPGGGVADRSGPHRANPGHGFCSGRAAVPARRRPRVNGGGQETGERQAVEPVGQPPGGSGPAEIQSDIVGGTDPTTTLYRPPHREARAAVTHVYNPIVRVYFRFRRAAAAATGLPLRAIRPGVPLETLLPVRTRRRAWRRLRAQGLRLPGLGLSSQASWVCIAAVLVSTLAAAAYYRDWTALWFAVPLVIVAYLASRPWATAIPLGLRTAGELSFALTSFREHRHSGYRWTPNEVSLRVRMLLADALNVPLDQIRPDSTLRELGAE